MVSIIFSHNRVIATRESYRASRGLKGMVAGCLPQRWPIWLKPELVDMDGPAIGPFATSHPITRDGRIFLVPTPGHSKGHVSVVVRAEDVTYFIAGDATYDDENLRAEKADGVTYDPALSQSTLKKIKTFATGEPTVVLPAHDPRSTARLLAKEIF